MLNFSITRPVGKQCAHTSAVDIKTIQCVLKAIKTKEFKPLYAGKVDGVAGPKTVAAICDFQALENLKVTGKIAPSGADITKHRSKTPSSAKSDIASAAFAPATPGTAAQTTSPELARARREAKYVIDKFETSAPVRDADTKCLAGVLRGLASGGVVVMPVFLDSDRSSGHMLVELEALHPKPQDQAARKALADRIKAAFQGKAEWSLASGTKLILKSTKPYPSLKGNHVASRAFLKMLGLEARFDYSITMRHLGGLEQEARGPARRSLLMDMAKVLSREKKIEQIRLSANIVRAFSPTSHPDPYLSFDGRHLKWHGFPYDGMTWQGVSGAEGFQHKEHQSIENKGPVPEGEWYVRQSEAYSITDVPILNRIAGMLSPLTSPVTGKMGLWPGDVVAWGTKRIWLRPKMVPNLYGRSEFSIHGGLEWGSAGCVDLTYNMLDFERHFRSYGADMILEVGYENTH